MAIGLVGHRGGGVVTATRAILLLLPAGLSLALQFAPVAMTDELHHHQLAAPHAPALPPCHATR